MAVTDKKTAHLGAVFFGGIAKGERLATGMVSNVSQNRETYNRAFQEKRTDNNWWICGDGYVLTLYLQKCYDFWKIF